MTGEFILTSTEFILETEHFILTTTKIIFTPEEFIPEPTKFILTPAGFILMAVKFIFVPKEIILQGSIFIIAAVTINTNTLKHSLARVTDSIYGPVPFLCSVNRKMDCSEPTTEEPERFPLVCGESRETNPEWDGRFITAT